MSNDLSEFLSLLRFHRVEFLVIGSHLLALYARPRFTEDLDVWIRRTEENVLKLAKALREFGFSIEDEQALRLAKGRHVLRMGRAPNRIDVLSFNGAVGRELDFEAANRRAVEAELMGETVRCLSLTDFVRSKRDAGRPKDLSDLAELESILGELPQEPTGG